MEMIGDGEGKGFLAGVTGNNRLKTTGVDLTLTEAATESGDTFNLDSTTVALSTTGESALLYLRNLEDTTLIVTSIAIALKDYVGTDGQPTLQIYRNPTAGTIVSVAAECNEQNRNYGSNKELTIDCFRGVEGSTMTGEDNRVTIFLPTTAAATLVTFSTLVALPKGASIGLSWTPPAGMTTVNILAAFETTLNGTQL